MKEVLDTRFFIAHLVEADPRVHDRTRAKLRDLRRRGDGVVPAIVVAEFFDQVCRRAGRRAATRMCDAILASGLDVRPLTAAVARAAGALRCGTRDIPLADCVIAATAAQLGGKVISDDPHFHELRGVSVAWL